MDTKWKSNDKRSVFIACAIMLVFTFVFMACLPLFEERAGNAFEDPFTDNYFIRRLYESNYIQYKYLRERVEQRNYSFGELFVDAEFTGTESEGGYGHGQTVTVNEDVTGQGSALDNSVNAYKEETVMGLWEVKSRAQELTQKMDYYAVDKDTGIFIGNSSQSALKDIVNGMSPAQNPYIYYVYVNYDGVGNIENCSVSTTGKVGEFLKRVESLGRETYKNDYYNADGICYVDYYNENFDESYRYKLTLKRPANMKIVYAMTVEQYEAFLNGTEHYSFLPDYVSTSEQSYYASGIIGTLFTFGAAAVLLGFCCVYILNHKDRDYYTYQKLRICQFPLEINILLFAGGMLAGTFMVDQICAYQKGWFLPNITKQLLTPNLLWIRWFLLAALFFVYFMAAFTLGSVIPELLHFRRYFKRHSLLYRYWGRILAYLHNFYRELVNFDIGTDARRIILKLVIANFLLLAFMSLFWVWGVFFMAIYSVTVYFMLKKYVKDIQNKYQSLLRATSAIARGDLDIVLSEDFGVFESYKNELRQIQVDFKRAVDEEVKSQRMKSELITNVSHDLKTPLTAIITYINLLKVPGITQEQQAEYIETLDKKAVRLKVLIEDLFEVSKATTNNITLNYDKVDIGNLLHQCYLEYEDRIEAANLQFKFILPEKKVVLTLDPQKTFRIFENLYTNAVKYALSSTRVYITLRDWEDEAEIEIKNISRSELDMAPEELTERFVRGDGARNTEGSGLGLAIARSFTELQHGTLQISLDGDLFKVLLVFRKWDHAPKPEPEATKQTPSGTNAKIPVPNQSFGLTPAEQTDIFPKVSPKHVYDPRRWRSGKNLKKKRG